MKKENGRRSGTQRKDNCMGNNKTQNGKKKVDQEKIKNERKESKIEKIIN